MGCRVLVGDRGYIMQMVSCGPNNVIIVFASCIMCKRSGVSWRPVPTNKSWMALRRFLVVS